MELLLKGLSRDRQAFSFMPTSPSVPTATGQLAVLPDLVEGDDDHQRQPLRAIVMK